VGDPMTAPADEETIERWKRIGEITGEQAAVNLLALRNWQPRVARLTCCIWIGPYCVRRRLQMLGMKP
jgi:hypothetical protein